MKVLLGENLPHDLRQHITEHDVWTAVYAGFSGLENGELLRKAEEAAFEVLVTGDRNLAYQQNLKDRKIAIVELNDQRWAALRERVHLVNAAIAAVEPAGYRASRGSGW